MKGQINPSQRDDLNSISDQALQVLKLDHIRDILSAVSSVVLVLNDKRQVVFANDALLEKYNISDTRNILGFRPGEIMSCENANNSTGGCGTALDCRYCGVINSIVKSKEIKQQVREEARITIRTEKDFVQVDLLVTAKPFTYNKVDYTIYSAEDITEKKQKDLMERIFFHDIINLAGSLEGVMSMIGELRADEASGYIKTAKKVSSQLLDEILAHQDILRAEKNELKVHQQALVCSDIVNELVEKASLHRVMKNKMIVVKAAPEDEGLITDPILLERVLFNMLKNACEASENGDNVEFRASHINDDLVAFEVHNNSYMPTDVQLQLFKRSFSTKGVGRGLGTYSMKLIGEKYLGGKIDFKSTVNEGTTFRLLLPIHPKASLDLQ